MRDLEKILDIEPSEGPTSIERAKQALQNVEENYNSVFMVGDDQRFYDDFEVVRESLKEVINEYRSSIAKLSMIAFDTEKAAHFSALSQMTTVLLNANKQLLEIYGAKKKYYEVTKKTQQPTTAAEPSSITVQNAIFTGTTHDLKKWIDDLKAKEGN